MGGPGGPLGSAPQHFSINVKSEGEVHAPLLGTIRPAFFNLLVYNAADLVLVKTEKK